LPSAAINPKATTAYEEKIAGSAGTVADKSNAVGAFYFIITAQQIVSSLKIAEKLDDN
jgi:hypothetical protein